MKDHRETRLHIYLYYMKGIILYRVEPEPSETDFTLLLYLRVSTSFGSR